MSQQRKSNFQFSRPLIYLTVGVLIGLGVYVTAPTWLTWLPANTSPSASANTQSDAQAEVTQVRISSQARANLGLKSTPAKPQSYWRKLQTTGVIVDRPGFTDRGVTSPVDAIVTNIHSYQGDIVRPGDVLFTLRLASEHLQDTQADFFKAQREIEILQQEILRIKELASTGVIPEKRMIELQQNVSRQKALLNSHRQELLARGLNQEHLQRIEGGQFIKSIEVRAPGDVARTAIDRQKTDSNAVTLAATIFEVQDLQVELGQQVVAGTVLSILANHHYLFINGHGFKTEATQIAQAAELGWDLEIEFLEDVSTAWPAMNQSFQIRHLANTIDLESRTFDFFIPLTNQSRRYTKNGAPFVIWRFRPGQRVRIHVPVDAMTDVFVVSTDAVVRDGPNAYVFQQNGDFFNRIPVHVIHEDRLHSVIANDGMILPGMYLAQRAAATLNRVLKAQSASGGTEDVHVHADGTTHANH